MRLTKLENVSSENVKIEQPSGGQFMLTPGNSVEHVEISNLHEVLGQVKVSHDLTEVVDSQPRRRAING